MTEPTDAATDAVPDTEGFADFDAFFAEQAEAAPAGVPLRLYGREWRLPPSLPLMFTLQLDRVRDSSAPQDIRRMLAALFGPEALDTWADHGMTDEQLGVVLVWATSNCVKPGSVSMQRAAEMYAEREDAKGKAGAPPNRAARRAKKGKKAASGPQS